MHAAFAHFQIFFQRYGLAAVFAVLLLENFGLPLPGELALLYAGYHAYTRGAFGLSELVLTASLACILGQALGYRLGRRYSAPARRWLRLTGAREALVEAYFRRHGPVTIVFARFITGLRMWAGPVAGLSHMPWKPFLAYNIIGALAWTAAISAAGALLGAHWRRLVQLVGRADIIILVAAAAAIIVAWRRLRRGGDPGGSL